MEGASRRLLVIADQAAVLPAVLTTKELSFVGLLDRISALGFSGRARHADLSHQLWQPFRELRPRIPTVGGLPDPATRSPAAHLPRQPLVIPERRIENARIGRIHRQVTGAARRVETLENQRPRPSAIDGAIDAAVARALPPVALRGDVDDVGIRRMHAHLRDLLRRLEPERLPCLSR